jgi:hypothetical protein
MQSKHTDRIAVVVTGFGTTKLLGIPKTDSGKGENQAQIIFQLLQEWGLVKYVKGMSFDTTASNTGIHKGACVLLEDLVGRRLLYFACRHHIFELVAKAVFFEVFGASKSPEVAMFNDFKKKWETIDKQSYKSLRTDLFRKTFTRSAKKEVVAFVTKVCNFFFTILSFKIIISGTGKSDQSTSRRLSGDV